MTSVPPSAHIAHALTFVAQPDRRQMTDRRKHWRGGRRVSDFSAFAQRALPTPQSFDAHDHQGTRTERLH
jgi:hypothetical protein